MLLDGWLGQDLQQLPAGRQPCNKPSMQAQGVHSPPKMQDIKHEGWPDIQSNTSFLSEDIDQQEQSAEQDTRPVLQPWAVSCRKQHAVSFTQVTCRGRLMHGRPGP